ncbi:MAG: hypothetical protein R3F36_13825 [Candidatus Competibacteraceae bacterium]
MNREIKRLEGRIVDHRSEMGSEMDSLRRKKQLANNSSSYNLGAEYLG